MASEEPSEPTRVPSCFATFASFIIFALLCPLWAIFLVVLLLGGCFVCCGGQSWVWRWISAFRFHVLINHPPNDMSAWGLFCRRLVFVFELADWLLVLKTKDLQAAILARSRVEQGDSFVWMSWPMVTSHTKVTQFVSQAENYTRSLASAGIPISPYTTSPTVMVFSNGHIHDNQRAGVIKMLAHPALVETIDNFETIFATEIAELIASSNNGIWDHHQGPLVFSNKVLYRMFLGMELTEQELALCLEYGTKLVVYKALHPVLHNMLFFNKLAKFYGQKNRALGKVVERSEFLDIFAAECPMFTREQSAMELHLIIHANIPKVAELLTIAFNYISSDRKRLAPLAVANPDSFIWEIARLNPGVPVSILTLKQPSEVTFRGKVYIAKAGAQIGSCLVAANRDHVVFPDPELLKLDRTFEKDDILSWGTTGHNPAYRSCLGIKISYAILKHCIIACGRALSEENAGAQAA